MVGLIHHVLFDLILSAAGPQVLAKVKEHAGVSPEQQFRIDEAYDDLEWRRLLASTCELLGIEPSKAEELYADHFCKDAQERWPRWFQISRTGREFLERQPAIHNGFASGVRDAEQRQKIRDKFVLEKSDDELIVHYRSPNQLCGLYKALARAIFRHYGEEAEISEVLCVKRGDPECEIHVWCPVEPASAIEAGSSTRRTEG